MYKLFFITIFISFNLLANNTQKEINHLINFIDKSSCKFIRNGDEHNTTEAIKHINKNMIII